MKRVLIAALALVALPIVILIGLIYYVTYYWLHGWLKFLIATLVLLYCLGPEDLYRQKQKGTVSQDIFWQANEKLFAVLFWFALIGPVAAVLYRVVEQLTKSEQRGNVVNHELAKSANTLLFILDIKKIKFFIYL
jgi:membrane protein required for beta-lactamase induction